MWDLIRGYLGALRDAFVSPTGKQKEAYGRFLHNVAAACLFAATSILFTENRYGIGHVAALLAIGVTCFVAGSLSCKGD